MYIDTQRLQRAAAERAGSISESVLGLPVRLLTECNADSLVSAIPVGDAKAPVDRRSAIRHPSTTGSLGGAHAATRPTLS